MTQPGSVANTVPVRNDPGALLRMIRDLQTQVKALQGALTVNGLTVNGQPGIIVQNGGSITLTDPASGRIVAYLGTAVIPDGSGRVQMDVKLTRDDGTPALQLADNGTVPGHAHQQALQWYDRAGNTVFADDTTSGQGVADPWIPLGEWVSVSTYPTDTTTSSTFTTLQTCTGFKQHPQVTMQALVRSSDGSTTGEVRVVDAASNIIGVVQTITAGSYGFYNFGPAPIVGAHQSSIGLSLQARVTAGSGTIGVRGSLVLGVRS